MPPSEYSTHGLIRSCNRWNRVGPIDGVETLDLFIAQQPCSQQRWQEIYAERNAVEGTTFHGRYHQGVVDLFLDEDGEVGSNIRFTEPPGLKQFLQDKGATVRIYDAQLNDVHRPVQEEEDEDGMTDMLKPVADFFACERALLDRCKSTLLGIITTAYPDVQHILLADSGVEYTSLLLLIVNEPLFEETYSISTTHQLATITANKVKYAVIGLYEKAAADEEGEVEFCCSSDRVVSFFSEDGNHAVVNVLDLGAEARGDYSSPQDHKIAGGHVGGLEGHLHDTERMSTVQETKV